MPTTKEKTEMTQIGTKNTGYNKDGWYHSNRIDISALGAKIIETTERSCRQTA